MNWKEYAYVNFGRKQKPNRIIEKAIYLLEFGTANNYGHFVMDCLWKIQMLEENNFSGSYLLYDSAFAREWIKLLDELYLGLSGKIIWIDSCKDTILGIKELLCLDTVVETSVASLN